MQFLQCLSSADRLRASIFIIATLMLSGCSGSSSGTTTPVPTAVKLTSITIRPATATIARGQISHFTASATYTDNTTADITSQVTWVSSDTVAATIDNTGLATTLTTGPTDITARSGGITSNIAVVTVVSPVSFGVMAESAPSQVTLSWSPVTGATSYNLYWATTAGVTTAENKVVGINSPYIHSGLTDGNT